MTTEKQLPSWRPGATRDAVVEFLGGADDVPPRDRVAVVDNDGTLWCEKPRYIQRLVGRRPILAAGNSPGDSEMPEYAMSSDGPTSPPGSAGP